MKINNSSVQNRSGKYLDFANPAPDQFTIFDIASGLARECRFNGQTSKPYSVAQHSVLASLIVPKEHALAALVHDGSEAMMRDISSPLKAMLRDYRVLERRIQQAIHEHVGLPAELDAEVEAIIKQADLKVFATERAQLMPTDGYEWPVTPALEPLGFKIHCMDEKEAFYYFVDRYVSIIEDRPFIKERALWQAQQNDWVMRQVAEDPPIESLGDYARPRAA